MSKIVKNFILLNVLVCIHTSKNGVEKSLNPKYFRKRQTIDKLLLSYKSL